MYGAFFLYYFKENRTFVFFFRVLGQSLEHPSSWIGRAVVFGSLTTCCLRWRNYYLVRVKESVAVRDSIDPAIPVPPGDDSGRQVGSTV
jgi:hypothetical protein